MVAALRLYRGPDEMDYQPAPDADVRVRLGDLLPLVAFAQKMNFMWLKDFQDDEVKITEDLYEVLQSFRGMRPVA